LGLGAGGGFSPQSITVFSGGTTIPGSDFKIEQGIGIKLVNIVIYRATAKSLLKLNSVVRGIRRSAITYIERAVWHSRGCKTQSRFGINDMNFI
jgi:hypothetical protein